MKCTKKVHQTEIEANLYQLKWYLIHTDIDIVECEKLYRVYYCRKHRGWHITTQILKGNEMSKEFVFNWDDNEKVDPIQIGSYPDWGFLKMVTFGDKPFKNVTLFSKGATLTLPEIVVNGQPWSRNGIKEGGNSRAFFFTLYGENAQTSEPFKLVKIFTSNPQYEIEDMSKYPHIWLDEVQKKYLAEKGKTRVSDWVNLQKPALRATLGPQVSALQDGLWVKAETTVYEVREDVTQTDNEGKPKKYYNKYWTGFTIYPTKEAMLAARQAEMSEDNSTQPASPYPVAWNITDQWPLSTYLDIAKKSLAANPDDLKKAAIAAKLLNADGSLADTPNGSPVAVETIANVFGKTVTEVNATGIVDSPF